MINVLQNLDWSVLGDLLIRVIPVLVCITVHECCHGLCALALGDTTAKDAGRLSLNPIKHFDLMGAVMMLVAGFGWAKPVPVDMRRFKNPRAGMALTALAGPASNMVLAVLCLFIYGLLFRPLYDNAVGDYVLATLYYTAYISVSLGIFNLIPLPPLDGSKVAFSFLPEEWYYKLMRYERYIAIALFIIIMLGVLSGPLSYVTERVFDAFMNVAYWGDDITSLFM